METFETPLTKNFDFFKTHLEDNWREHWSVQSVEIIRDAYCVGISEMWTENRLLADNYFEIYKKIITKCRSLIIEAIKRGDDAWKEQLETTRRHYQIELLTILTVTIREYCMEA